MKFEQMQYRRPDKEAIKQKYLDITAKLPKCNIAALQLDLVREHEHILAEYQTMEAIAYIRHTVDTNDAFYEAEQDFFDNYSPEFEELKQGFLKELVKSPYIEDLKSDLGELFFKNIEIALKTFSPEIIDLLKKENMLVTEYQKLIASAQIDFNGEILNLSQIRAYQESADREVRKQAFEKAGEFFNANAVRLDEIYDELVKIRTEQAKKLGFNNFVELGYLRMTRNSYTPSDVEVFRKQVANDLVPLVEIIKKRQADRIGLNELKLYDDNCLFLDGNPKPYGTPDEILENGRKMYHEMGEITGDFIDFMLENNLLDVLSKKGKAGGGYCTFIPNYKAPFIFANFNGTSGDVDVLTHEAGHALAAYIAKDIPILENGNPTYETCEVHSMSMEFFAWPWQNLFFKEDAEKYKTMHLESALSFIPYGTLVDEFQHIVYNNPELTPAQRKEEWLKLENRYRPYLDFKDIPFFENGGGYQRQSHIYSTPFYYIDYCLAQTIALQFWCHAKDNREEAFKKYLEFVSKAGTQTFVDLVLGAGLKSPFKDGAIKEISDSIMEWLNNR